MESPWYAVINDPYQERNTSAMPPVPGELLVHKVLVCTDLFTFHSTFMKCLLLKCFHERLIHVDFVVDNVGYKLCRTSFMQRKEKEHSMHV